jgi:hypothetical protein
MGENGSKRGLKKGTLGFILSDGLGVGWSSFEAIGYMGRFSGAAL